MIDLRNPDLRTRDIRKIVGYKSQSIIWDEGCDKTSEWVIASFKTEASTKKLCSWIEEKNIKPSNECILVNTGWSAPKWLKWSDISKDRVKYFGNESFSVYDIDLSWVLEYHKMEIVRFGRFTEKDNTNV